MYLIGWDLIEFNFVIFMILQGIFSHI